MTLKKIVLRPLNPPATSWWTNHGRVGFYQRCLEEAPRMSGSRFAVQPLVMGRGDSRAEFVSRRLGAGFQIMEGM